MGTWALEKLQFAQQVAFGTPNTAITHPADRFPLVRINSTPATKIQMRVRGNYFVQTLRKRVFRAATGRVFRCWLVTLSTRYAP